MRTIKIKRGLDLPLSGGPEQKIHPGRPVGRVAVLGPDYNGMKPTMAVGPGDRVKLGQLLFEDKKIPGVRFTAPGCGTVVEVNRGEKRVLESVVIELDGHEEEAFSVCPAAMLETLTGEEVRKTLVASGLWTALRTRPFSHTPAVDSTPKAIFVTAIDTNPLAADPAVVLADRKDDFQDGLKVLSRLGAEKLFLCVAPKSAIPGLELKCVEPVAFAGVHPAGLPGTHIHFLRPVGRHTTVWHINYQDVAAIGRLFTTGRLDVQRVVALAGPSVKQPRLIRTRLGASLAELTEGELVEGDNRIISGSVLCGLQAEGHLAYLGRFHQQVSVLAEGRHRELFGWYSPGFRKYSLKNVVASKLIPDMKFPLTTATWGGPRAIVPIGSYEKVMPLDILPTFLFKALAIDDLEQAEALGCLELDEEDLALCTFVCPGKSDFGKMLRRNLTTIEKEG